MTFEILLDCTGYLVEVWATFDNVRYKISERFWDWEIQRWTWEPVLFGGCQQSAQLNCTQHVDDGDFGNFLVGSTSANTSQKWSAQQILVTHF